MKERCKKILLVPLLGLGIGAMAQTNLVVASKNALETAYDLSTVRAMYFAKDSLKVKTTNAAPKAYAINTVRKVHFKQSSLGISESFTQVKAENIAWLWPNPAEREITFGIHASEAQVSIYDQTGRLVLQQPLNALQMSLDISLLAQGLYVAKIATPSQSQTISFLKK